MITPEVKKLMLFISMLLHNDCIYVDLNRDWVKKSFLPRDDSIFASWLGLISKYVLEDVLEIPLSLMDGNKNKEIDGVGCKQKQRLNVFSRLHILVMYLLMNCF